MWRAEVAGTGWVNRPGMATKSKRRAAKLGNHNWFKKVGKSKETQMGNKPRKEKGKPQARIEGILFCPYTADSRLKKELAKIEEFVNGDRRSGKIRIV